MTSFTRSAWFPVVTMLILALVTTGMYAVLNPNAGAVGHYEIARIATMVGWGAGGAIALFSLLLIGLVNGALRLFGLRALGPLMVLLCTVLWLVTAWNLTAEPRFTPLARAVIDFLARPLLWGGLVSTVFALICLCLPTKK